MKNIYKISTVFFLAVFSFSCQEDLVEKAVLNTTVESNAMINMPSESYILLEDNVSDDFDSFGWSPTNFGFPASVAYTLQVDLGSNDFGSPADLTITFDLSSIITIGDLNNALLSLGLVADEASELQFRVVSNIEGNIDPVYSTMIALTITPYAPSVLKPLYVMGDDQDWDLAKALQLKALDIGEYEVIGEFGNGSYWRFFEEPLWDAKQYGYSFFETIDSNLTDGGGGDSNFIFSGTTGVYKMIISLNDKSISVEAVNTPQMFIVGGPNWNFDVETTWIGGGKYEGLFDFTNGDIFRFFTVKDDWGSVQYNYTYFMDGTLSNNLSGTTEGDANFTFDGATGAHNFTVDIYNKEFIVTE